MLTCPLAWIALFQTASLISGALEVAFWRCLVVSMRFRPTSQLPSSAVGFMTLLVPLMDDLPPKCFCGAALTDDPQHFLSCSMLKRRAMTVRHDSVVRLLRDFFHHAGALVHIEPRIYE